MTDDLIGKKFGGYEILDVIGKGGMATVYRAHQLSMNRTVALKILPRQFLNDDTYLQRFEREVQIVSQLEHRNIVPVHDYGEEDGQPFIVMRYMSGGSVDDLIKHGPLPLEQIVSIIEQIAPALDYAHSKDVLHRDLKPSNVLMDDNGGAYLTDFGIARILNEASGTITTQGVVGTPAYMSPEQAQGRPLDGRSDIYSLGVMLFEMATGKRPFEGDTPYGTAVLQVTAPPPTPRSLNPNLPATVERVILTALNKHREARYETAAMLADALRRALTLAESRDALHDTQPGFPRPEALVTREDHAAEATQPSPVSVAFTPPPPNLTPPYSGPVSTPNTPSSFVPSVARGRRTSRRANLFVSALIGGGLGCLLLLLIMLVAWLALLALDDRSAAIETQEVTEGTDTLPNDAEELSRLAQTRAAVRANTLSTADSSGFSPATASASQGTVVAGALTPGASMIATDFAPVGERPTSTPILVDGARGLIVYASDRGGSFKLYRLDLGTGEETQLTFGSGDDLSPAVSPRGDQVAFVSDRDGDFEIYMIDIDGRNLRQLTENDVTDRAPVWNTDGTAIAFSSDARGGGLHDLAQVSIDGGGAPMLLWSDDLRNTDPYYTSDGTMLLFAGGTPREGSDWEIKRLELATGSVERLTDNTVRDWGPVSLPDGSIYFLTEGEGGSAIARLTGEETVTVVYDGIGYEWGLAPDPDGSFLVFTSDVSGRDELYLLPLADPTAGPQQITTSGALDAAWTRSPAVDGGA